MAHFLIRFGLHLVILYSCWMIASMLIDTSLRKSFKQYDYKLQMRVQSLGNNLGRYKKAAKIIEHIDQMLSFTKSDYERGVTVIQYLIKVLFVAGSIFIGSLLTLENLPALLASNNPFEIQATTNDIYINQWQTPVLLAVLSLFFQYILLATQYKKNNIRSSFDLSDVVKLMTKFTNLSTDAMLERTSELLPKNNVLKGPLKGLAHTFLTYSSENELHREVNKFSQLIGTTFATQLSQALIYAEREGQRNLNNTLFRIARAMQEQNDVIKKVKSNSSEAIQMGFYINLFVFCITVIPVMIFLTPSVYLKLQFGTKIGVYMFGFIMVGLFLSFCFSVFLSKPKLDYH